MKLGRSAWSPDGNWIAFSYFRGDNDGGLAIVKPEETGFRELRKFDGWPGWELPTWAADSRRVAFGGDDTGGNRGELWIFSLEDDSGFRAARGSAGYPSWRPVK